MEEWGLLDARQRALCHHVIQENYGDAIALGEPATHNALGQAPPFPSHNPLGQPLPVHSPAQGAVACPPAFPYTDPRQPSAPFPTIPWSGPRPPVHHAAGQPPSHPAWGVPPEVTPVATSCPSPLAGGALGLPGHGGPLVVTVGLAGRLLGARAGRYLPAGARGRGLRPGPAPWRPPPWAPRW